MARLSPRTDPASAARKNAAICATCGKDMTAKPFEWSPSQTAHHCNGSRWAFRAHFDQHGHHCPYPKHPPCWLCRADMGCLACSGIVQELLCENAEQHRGLGAVWASRQAFHEHGPLLRQRPHRVRASLETAKSQSTADYPREWSRGDFPTEEECGDANQN